MDTGSVQSDYSIVQSYFNARMCWIAGVKTSDLYVLSSKLAHEPFL